MTTIPSLTLTDKRRTTKPPAEGLTPTWRDAKACTGVDPAIFFPGQGQGAARAKAICASCPVTAECLTEAMTPPYEAFGVWGGLSERERLRIRRGRKPIASRYAKPGSMRHRLLAHVAKVGTWDGDSHALAAHVLGNRPGAPGAVIDAIQAGLMAGERSSGPGRPYTSLTLTDVGREHLARLEAAS